MSAKKMALGRGLSALINNSSEEEIPEISLQEQVVANAEIPIDKIEANPLQPRTSFDEDTLDELAASIKIHGVIQPLTLRLLDSGMYQIISGERRYRASKLAGLTSLPAYVRTANDQETLEMALIENIQREDLDAMEVAISYRRLMEECNLTPEKLGERVGKKRVTVTNYLRLLNLPDEIQEFLRDRRMSMGHARALVSIENTSIQRTLARKIVEEGWSVRQVEEAVKKMSAEKIKKTKSQTNQESLDNLDHEELPDNYYTLVELLELHFNNKINIKRNAKGEGSITIDFNSDEDINVFIENLTK